MDLLSSVSRWLVHKRVEMHQLFEQWAQGCPKAERASSIGSAKRLTHTQADSSVLNILKRLPMTMSSVTSDKYASQTEVMEGPQNCYNIAFPVVGPQDKPNIGPVPVNCVGGQLAPATPIPAGCQNQPYYSESGFQKLMPGMSRNGFQGPGQTGGQNQTPPSFQPDVSKSPLWKHIFAPPFIPASCKRKYPYNTENNEPTPMCSFSDIYPYVHYIGPSPNVRETTQVAPSYVYHHNSQGCAQSFHQAEHYGHVQQPAFTPLMNGGASQHCFIPFMFHLGVQPSQVPTQVHRVQVIVSPQAQPPPTQQTCVPNSTQSETKTGSPSQNAQRTVPSELLTASPAKRETATDSVSEIVNGIGSMHLSNRHAKQEVGSSRSPGSSSRGREHVTVTEELTCDSQKCDSVSNKDSVSSAACQKSGAHENTPTMETFERRALFNVEVNCIQQKRSLHPQTPHPSSEKPFSVNKQAQTPNSSPRKKRKSRPSAEKRRRRRMAAVCTISKEPECSEEQSTKKLKTEHQSDSKPSGSGKSKHTTIAFILGLDSDGEDSCDDSSEGSEGRAQPKTYCSFSISSLNSDSDFDDDFDNVDGCDGNIDETAWGELNISLDPFNPFNFQCLSATPRPIKKTSSAPELTVLNAAASGSPETGHLQLHCQPRRKSLFGKHVNFARDEELVVVHTIDEDLDAYEEARKGPWELYARDRCRFKKRIEEVEQAISYIFETDHRDRVQTRLSCQEKSLQSSSQ